MDTYRIGGNIKYFYDQFLTASVSLWWTLLLPSLHLNKKKSIEEFRNEIYRIDLEKKKWSKDCIWQLEILSAPVAVNWFDSHPYYSLYIEKTIHICSKSFTAIHHPNREKSLGWWTNGHPAAFSHAPAEWHYKNNRRIWICCRVLGEAFWTQRV